MLKDLLERSRSYRSFDRSVPISEELLLDWVEHARLCPSSINLQMIKFRPVTSPEECAALLPLTRWAGKLKDISLPPKGHEPVAYLVVCTDDGVIADAEKFQKDVGIVSQTVMLAAAEAGFGGCMIGSFSAEEVTTLLSLPKGISPQLILALGKPDEEVRLVGEAADGSVTYYREGGVHYVQKRDAAHLLIGGKAT